MTVLQLNTISYSYGGRKPALRDVSLSVRQGELLSIIGPNGSGKSTLMKILARVIDPEEGVVTLEGRPLVEWNGREYARRVGYLAQDLDIPFPMTALDVVLSGRGPHLRRFEWEGSEEVQRAHTALARCDAAELAPRYVHEMSGGERKRVFMARVLVGEPSLLLLDEPLAALDVQHIAQLAMLLRSFVDQEGRSVVLISHDFNWASAISDRVVVMAEGQIAAEGTASEVLTVENVRDFFGITVDVMSSANGRPWVIPHLP